MAGTIGEDPPQPFILFLADNSPNSRSALANLHRALVHLGRPESDIEIIDVFERPDLAASARVFVTPALLRRSDPQSRIQGDLSTSRQLLEFLR
jgi:circadian clock protein KaiB